MKVFSKEYFRNLKRLRLLKWLKNNQEMLAGSCVATKSNIRLSKLICKLSEKRTIIGDFIPSHIGSIVQKDGVLYLVNMKPPKCDKIELLDYILTTDEEFMLVLRDFELDTAQFSQDILKYDGKKYAYFSALQCAFKGIEWIPNFGSHCSELHARYLQQQGYFLQTHCDNLMPVEVYEKLVLGDIW